MNKILVPSGSSQKLEQLFDTIQNTLNNNLLKRFNLLVDPVTYNTGGIISNTTDGSFIDTSLKLSIASNTAPSITIAAGTGVLKNNSYNEIIDLTSNLNNYVLSGLSANSYYLIKLKYINSYSDPISAQSGFYYDTTGIATGSQKYTKQNDSYTVIATELATFTDYYNSVANNEVVIAGVATDASSYLKTTTWSNGGYTSGADGVLDLRGYIKLNSKLLDNITSAISGKDFYTENVLAVKYGNNLTKLDSGTITLSGTSPTMSLITASGITFSLASTSNLTSFDFKGALSFKNSNSDPTLFNIFKNSDPLFIVDIQNKTVKINTDEVDSKYTLMISGNTVITGNTNTHSKALDVKGDINIDGSIYINNELVPLYTNLMSNTILNFKIDSISAFNVGTLIDPGYTGQVSNRALSNNKIKVKLTWGQTNILGTSVSSSDTFSVTSSGIWPVAVAADLEDQFLYFPTIDNGITLRILSAGGIGNRDLTLRKLDGTVWTSPGFTLLSNPDQRAVLTANADKYIIEAVPIISNAESLADKITIISNSTSDVKESHYCNLYLDPGVYYNIYIQGEKGGKLTERVECANNPVLAVLPDLPVNEDNGSISLTPTPNGFNVKIIGWSTLDDFEIAYTSDNVAEASFTDATHNKVITKSKSIDIVTNTSATYQIKVSPVSGGLRVGTEKTGSVMSGSGGVLPQVGVIASTYIDFDTYRGTLTANGEQAYDVDNNDNAAKNYKVTLTNFGRYIYQTNGEYLTSLPSTLIGELLTDSNSKSYKIVSIAYNSSSNALVTLTNAGADRTAPTNGTFTIGNIKDSRVVYKSGKFPLNYKITRIDVDCDVLKTNDSTKHINLRVYQEGKEEFADSVTITATDTQFTIDSDIELTDVYGDRNLIIDLYDPDTAANNQIGFAGQVTIYGTPSLQPKVYTQYIQNPVVSV